MAEVRFLILKKSKMMIKKENFDFDVGLKHFLEENISVP
jgi:hypothetical protein